MIKIKKGASQRSQVTWYLNVEKSFSRVTLFLHYGPDLETKIVSKSFVEH